MARTGHWGVEAEQVVDKTSHPLVRWTGVVAPLAVQRSNNVVACLEPGQPDLRRWAPARTTWYLNQAGQAG